MHPTLCASYFSLKVYLAIKMNVQYATSQFGRCFPASTLQCTPKKRQCHKLPNINLSQMHPNNKIVWTNVFQAHAQEPPSAPTHAKKCFPVLQSLAATPLLAEQMLLIKLPESVICPGLHTLSKLQPIQKRQLNYDNFSLYKI